jgi:hypothetical protein
VGGVPASEGHSASSSDTLLEAGALHLQIEQSRYSDTLKHNWEGKRKNRDELLLGQSSMDPGRQPASLYLEPAVVGARVLRGQMLSLVADGPPGEAVRSAWRVQESRRYVYIPSAGRQPKDSNSEGDIDWPFRVEGEFDDGTLISIVEFIRSKPRVPVPAFAQQVSGAPISVIARVDDV